MKKEEQKSYSAEVAPLANFECETLHNPNCLQFIYKEGADYICSNSNCPAQNFKRILHWCKVMDIKGLNEATLAKLMQIREE